MIALLAAMDRNHVIGYQSEMPWHLPNDLKFFKQITTGHTIIMGRKTFESIGRPLPNRNNIVLSSQVRSFPEGIEIVRRPETVLSRHEQSLTESFFVIGGETIFKQFLPYADRMYITWIDDVFPGDTYFPEFSQQEWHLSSQETGEKNARNPYDYYFLQYDRYQS
ncbi:dihydrofolate reductase DfrA [Barrientosiimonas marina]|uniref:Dihydrofolate reductase n=1 Tax=Lentibacillus kimchii TaxID=1542911 RepID=A0ABW2V1V3_9BACI